MNMFLLIKSNGFSGSGNVFSTSMLLVLAADVNEVRMVIVTVEEDLVDRFARFLPNFVSTELISILAKV